MDKLRSILAQLDFTYSIRDFDSKGVPFRTHLHVPEVHPETGNIYEREDPGHVLKVGHFHNIMLRYVSILFGILITCLYTHSGLLSVPEMGVQVRFSWNITWKH